MNDLSHEDQEHSLQHLQTSYEKATGLELKQQSYEDKAIQWMRLKRKDLCREIQHSERGYRSERRLGVDADETENFNHNHRGEGRFGRKRPALRLPPVPRGSIALKREVEA
ncbi:uncharacterized protein ARMOST_14795 [Armillaria ostoyae]|uniref:Uncharacterized protein n=1 Tax=Armillaria ostoyae TaxID=47428 RepID=A0A284RRJ6_ARMOS|nr:uncharacterized protein ARMOST_14795 [Armillaria ostoyae]